MMPPVGSYDPLTSVCQTSGQLELFTSSVSFGSSHLDSVFSEHCRLQLVSHVHQNTWFLCSDPRSLLLLDGSDSLKLQRSIRNCNSAQPLLGSAVLVLDETSASTYQQAVHQERRRISLEPNVGSVHPEESRLRQKEVLFSLHQFDPDSVSFRRR
ncbi:hypothetical protein XENORESO_000691 [Xenotaenia resolanae]|uniref:Uncharacterized protein n=1 Tax=Xenotaenia resolanae TaxID=208358 RepID=A0ABV0VTN5_9TELE